MRKRLALPLASLASLALLAGPVAAEDDTAVTFQLTAGSLTISAPPASNLGAVPVTSTTLSGPLGAVTVSDGRGLLVAQWSVTVSATDFTTGEPGEASDNEKVTRDRILYLTGDPTAEQGTGVFVGTGTSEAIGLLGLPAATWAGVGSNSVTWNPTVTVVLDGSEVAGDYAGTITHSVTGGL